MKKLIMLFFIINTCIWQSHVLATGSVHEQKYIARCKRTGYALMALAMTGIVVSCINSIDATEGQFLSTVQRYTKAPVPEYKGDMGFATYANNFCSQPWQKILFFTGTGLIPGVGLLLYSYYMQRQSCDK